jgi:hypothetical protein
MCSIIRRAALVNWTYGQEKEDGLNSFPFEVMERQAAA